MKIFANTKKIKDLFLKDIIQWMAIAGILLAIILLLNFTFDLFKGFGGFSIQLFLVFYAMAIYKIENLTVSIILFIIVPPLLFFMESGPYIINALQTFIEYFLVFYAFGIFYISKFIFYVVSEKTQLKFKRKSRQMIDLVIFLVTYVIAITIKFIIHSMASYYFWLDGKSWLAAFSYNFLGVFVNGMVTIPVLLCTSVPIFILFEKYKNLSKNKF